MTNEQEKALEALKKAVEAFEAMQDDGEKLYEAAAKVASLF